MIAPLIALSFVATQTISGEVVPITRADLERAYPPITEADFQPVYVPLPVPTGRWAIIPEAGVSDLSAIVRFPAARTMAAGPFWTPGRDEGARAYRALQTYVETHKPVRVASNMSIAGINSPMSVPPDQQAFVDRFQAENPTRLEDFNVQITGMTSPQGERVIVLQGYCAFNADDWERRWGRWADAGSCLFQAVLPPGSDAVAWFGYWDGY